MTSGAPGGTTVPRRRRTAIRGIATAIAGAAIALLALAPGAEAKIQYGVVPQDGALPSSNDLDKMAAGGIDSLRVMMPWGIVEQSPGKYDWSQTDAMFRALVEHGIAPYPFLYGTPSWAAENDRRKCSGPVCAIYAPKSAQTRAQFAAFAGAAADRYGVDGDFWKAPSSAVTGLVTSAPAEDPPTTDTDCPVPILCPPPPPPPPPPNEPPPPPSEPPCGCSVAHPITTWQVWNEQNSPKYFAPKAKPNQYAKLVRDTGTAIHAADPSAEVVLGGMWGPNSARHVVMPVEKYFKRFYRTKGIEQSFDSIAIHPYSNGAEDSVRQLEQAREYLDEAGDPKAGLWVSEIGWADGGPKSNPYVKGGKGQARILTRALTAYQHEKRSLHLRGVFWYSWRDKKGGNAICEWCGHSGLRKKNGSEKPAWRAFVRIARG
jgi:hypothetical protein